MEHAEAFVAAAEAASCPVVLQISENAAKYHGALAPIGLATLAVARASSADVVVHLDHATDRALVSEAIDLGFPSIMFDSSALPWEENLAQTIAVVEEAHASGVAVEAELGEVGGKDGVHAPEARTEPSEAARFVADTGVDALAVAVGSSHAMTERTAKLDLDLISRLRDAVAVPLVLHGSSGVSDEEMGHAIAAGMVKINISTHLNKVMSEALRTFLAENPAVVDPRKYLGAARTALQAEAQRLFGVVGW